MKAAVVGIILAIMLPLIVIVGVMAPSAAYDQVPLVPPSLITLYKDTAHSVSDARDVSISWQDLLTADTVRRNQQFDGVTAASITELAQQFTERHEKEACDPPKAPETQPSCHTVVTYMARTLAEVMDLLGFTTQQKEWALRLRAYSFDGLADVGGDCAPAGWTPHPLPGWTWPIPGYASISSCFGPRVDPVEHLDSFHYGLDVSAPTGTAVVAARDGIVTLAQYAGTCGNAVAVDHGSAGSTRFCHLSSTVVSATQHVTAGQVVGYVGSTGKSTGPHLHIEHYEAGSPVDPMNLFR